jgi:CHAT domain-containing protein/tetratricopeptide (TPR) repeat protein
MRTACRIVVPSLLGFVLLISPLAARAADEVQAKGRSPELTAEQRAKLTERDGLVREAEELRGQGKYAEALERATRALRLTRQVRGDESLEAAEDLARVAELHELSGDFKPAVQTRRQVLALRQKLDGEQHWRTGDARRALAFAEKLARLNEEQRAKVVAALRKGQEALRLDQQGKYAEAERKAVEVLATFQELLRKDCAESARMWDLLGSARWGRHDARGAKEAMERALGMRQAVLEKVHPDLGWSLYDLGMVLQDLSDLKGARAHLEEAVRIWKASMGRDHLLAGIGLYNLGNMQYELREYAAAKKSYEEALAISRKGWPPDSTDIAASLNSLGNVQVKLREYAAAKKSYAEALAIHRKALPQDHPYIAGSLNNVALAQENLREYAAAKKSYEEALAIFRKALPQSPPMAMSLNNLGNLQLRLREYAAAKKSYEEALAIRRKVLPKDHPDIALSLIGLGNLQYELREYAGAKKSYEEALAIRRKVLPEDHPDIALSLINLGTVRWNLREYAAAKKSYEEALAIHRKALPEDHPDIASSLISLGNVRWNLREYAAAKKSYEEALAIHRKALPQDHTDIAMNLDNLGSLTYLSGIDLGSAVSHLAEATDIHHGDQIHLAVAQAEKEQFTTAADTSRCLDLLLSASIATDAQPNQLYTRVVRVKGSVTTQQRWARQLRDTKDPETARLLGKLQGLTRQLTGLSVSDRPAGPSGTPQDMAALIQNLSEERAELERKLSARSAVYRALQEQALLGADDIRAELGKSHNVALLDFVDYLHWGVLTQWLRIPFSERRLVAFVVQPVQKSVTVVPLGSSELMAQRIDRWRASYGAGKAPPEGSADPAAELRKHLWEPLEKHLKGVKVVLVSPDGPLHGLPFAALPGAEPGTFLVRDYAFAVVPIPQLLPQLRKRIPQREKEPPSLLLAGGIDFGPSQARDREARTGKLPPIPTFKPLRGTESEVNDLRAQFEDTFPDAPAPKVLRRDKASKQAFLTAAAAHRFLHLATHGFFASPSEKSALDVAQRSTLLRDGLRMRVEATGRHPGLLSGVVFAGVNRPDRRPEETILTALEAGELDLGKVELVVLSACDTGRGHVAGGEGVLGLQRAFQLAGARCVVASLWSVPDEETHQLMREFYRRVWSDKPVAKAEALRQAQLWMLDNWKPRGGLVRQGTKGPPPPYVWAAFVLSGDWR